MTQTETQGSDTKRLPVFCPCSISRSERLEANWCSLLSCAAREKEKKKHNQPVLLSVCQWLATMTFLLWSHPCVIYYLVSALANLPWWQQERLLYESESEWLHYMVWHKETTHVFLRVKANSYETLLKNLIQVLFSVNGGAKDNIHNTPEKDIDNSHEHTYIMFCPYFCLYISSYVVVVTKQ